MFSPYASFPVPGSNIVDSIAAKMAAVPVKAEPTLTGRAAFQAADALRVHINATQYFDNVPTAA